MEQGKTKTISPYKLTFPPYTDYHVVYNQDKTKAAIMKGCIIYYVITVDYNSALGKIERSYWSTVVSACTYFFCKIFK